MDVVFCVSVACFALWGTFTSLPNVPHMYSFVSFLPNPLVWRVPWCDVVWHGMSQVAAAGNGVPRWPCVRRVQVCDGAH